MNKRDQQVVILSEYAFGNLTTEQTIAALDAIDTSAHQPFYAMMNQLDSDRHLLLAAQGDPKETRAAIDRLVSHLAGYAEKMGGG